MPLHSLKQELGMGTQQVLTKDTWPDKSFEDCQSPHTDPCIFLLMRKVCLRSILTSVLDSLKELATGGSVLAGASSDVSSMSGNNEMCSSLYGEV